MQLQERGHIALYALVILPLVCSFAVLAIDVSKYQALRDKAQVAADRITLQAAKALPNVDAARAIIEANIAREPLLELAPDVPPLISSSRVALTINAELSSSFDVFLPAAKVFSVQESAEVSIAPNDLVLIVADANSLRPAPRVNWGDASTWPASKYFNFARRPESIVGVSTEPSDVYWINWWKDWESELYRRWATQTCFNPVFSALKLAAISVLDVASTFSNFRTAVIFTPSEDTTRGYRISRELRFSADDNNAADASWFDYFETSDYVSDEACMLFGDLQASDQERYQLPQKALYLKQIESVEGGQSAATAGGSACPERFLSIGWGDIYYPRDRLTNCYRGSAVQPREAIYFHAARGVGHQPLGQNVLSAIDAGFVQLLKGNAEVNDEEKERRGNLSRSVRRQIVVLADMLPLSSSVRFAKVLERLEANSVMLVFAVYIHEFLPAQLRDELNQRAAAIEALKSKSIVVIKSESAQGLRLQIVPRLLSIGKEYVIRS